MAPTYVGDRGQGPWSGTPPLAVSAAPAPAAAPVPSSCAARRRSVAGLHALRRPHHAGLNPVCRKPIGYQLGKLSCDTRHVLALVGWTPVDHGIAHAEHDQHGEPGVGAARDAPVGDAGEDDMLECTLDRPRLAP